MAISAASVNIIANQIANQYDEVGEGETPEETFGDKIECNRIIRCQWASRWRMCEDILPWIEAGSGENFNQITIQKPQQYPYFTYIPLFADSIRMVPWVTNPAVYAPGHANPTDPGTLLTSPATTVAWQWAYLHVHYSSIPTTSAVSIVFDEEMRPCAEFMTLPSTGLFWTGTAGEAGVAVDPQSAPGLVLRKVEWTVTRRYCPLDFAAEVQSWVSCINKTTVTSLKYPGLSFPQNQLLYNGVDIQPDRNSDGSPACKLIMHFTGQNVSWNQYFNPLKSMNGTPVFENIYTSAESQSSSTQFTPYKEQELNYLLWGTISGS